MDMERINPDGLARPSGFSHAVSVPAGRLVFLAGQIGAGRDGKVVGGGIVAQFERALGNLLTALASAGGHPEDLVSLTVYLTDLPGYQGHAKEIGAVWRRLAGHDYPAMAGVGVTRLWDPEAVVEIQGVAAVSVLGKSSRYATNPLWAAGRSAAPIARAGQRPALASRFCMTLSGPADRASDEGPRGFFEP